MAANRRFQLSWARDGALLVAREPADGEVELHASGLCAWYNDEYNRRMMANSVPIDELAVIELYREMRERSGRPFLLFRDGDLVGDGDFRRIEGSRGEFAITVGPRVAQGQGLGTAFSVLLHTFAFQHLQLREVYLTIVAANLPGRRCYEKVGYRVDDGPVARAYADDEGDVAMVLTREAFLALHGRALEGIVITELPSG